MRIEEINNIPDKEERLKALQEYVESKLESQRQSFEEQAEYEEDIEPSRDEAGGMMSRFGKPGA